MTRAPRVRVTLSAEGVRTAWDGFFRDRVRGDVDAAALAEAHLVIRFWDVERYSEALADAILATPLTALLEADKALQPLRDLLRLTPEDAEHAAQDRAEHAARLEGHVREPTVPPGVRLVKCPDVTRVPIRALRSRHIGALTSVEGIVRLTQERRSAYSIAAFTCNNCQTTLRVSQRDYGALEEPLQCYEDQGGCGTSRHGFHLNRQDSTYVDVQLIELQETPEALRGGQQPARLEAYLTNGDCGTVKPGDRVTLNGFTNPIPRKKNGGVSVATATRFDVLGVEQATQDPEELGITPDEHAQIQALANDPAVMEKLAACIAPGLYGLHEEKESIALQLFSGVEKRHADGTRTRGESHILLIGDPGTGKSQLLNAASKLSARGIFANGKGSSQAGLTAIARQEEDGKWVYEAGALVLADQGLACVDELGQMNDQDRSVMHEALEQGTVTRNTAGGSITFNARCSVLAGANPEDGRFDLKYGSLQEQLGLEPPLLSRFDLIWPILDKPDKEQDAALARHVLRMHRAGAIRQDRAVHGDAHFTAAEEQGAGEVQPPIPVALLRKYVQYARQSCFPVLSPEVMEEVERRYAELRAQPAGEDGEGLAVTARQLEALVRLSEAGARIRLSPVVSMGDYERAWRLQQAAFQRLAGATGGGLLDIDLIASGVTHTRRDRAHRVLTIIAGLEGEDPRGANVNDVQAQALRLGIANEECREVLDRLAEDGRLTFPKGPGTQWVKRA